jgi:hypothetical protein
MSIKINPILPKHQPTAKYQPINKQKPVDTVKQNNQAVKYLAGKFGVDDETKPAKKTVGDFYQKVLKEQPLNEKDRDKKIQIPINLSKNATLEDYRLAADKAILQKAGYSMLNKDEIETARGLMKMEDKFNLENLKKLDKENNLFVKTSQYSIEKAKIAGQAVLQFKDYEAKLKDSNNAKAENETSQMLLDHGKVVYNSIVNNVEGTINLGMDLIRSDNGRNPLALVDPFRPRVDLSSIKADYRSEMMRRDVNGKLDGNGLKRGGFTEGAVTILAPLVVGKVTSPTRLNTLESLGALPEVTSIPKIGKLQIEQGRSLSPSEQNFADKMLAEGKDVKARTEVNLKGIKNPDFEVDGKLTEFKYVSDLKGTNADKLSGGLSRRILDGGSQAPKVTLDVSKQSGMTKEIAERAIKRAFGNLNDRGVNKFKEVRIYGKDFDITISYTQPKPIGGK